LRNTYSLRSPLAVLGLACHHNFFVGTILSKVASSALLHFVTARTATLQARKIPGRKGKV
jgi:hypothetical protein